MAWAPVTWHGLGLFRLDCGDVPQALACLKTAASAAKAAGREGEVLAKWGKSEVLNDLASTLARAGTRMEAADAASGEGGAQGRPRASSRDPPEPSSS